MNPLAHPAALSPVLLLHITAATAARLLGPLTLWARKGGAVHRRSGAFWVLLMLVASLSSLWIRDVRLPNVAGYTPIHLLTLTTLLGLGLAVWAVVVRRDIRRHRRGMQITYLAGCVLAGLFTLLPGRLIGHWLWHDTLGWL